MTRLSLNKILTHVSSIAFGCMGLCRGSSAGAITDEERRKAFLAIDTALENDLNFFDHADIYSMGKAEQVFGERLKENLSLREQIYIQSKCAIRFKDNETVGRYDHSKEWITLSVDNILKRLNTEYLDILLLHRPDPLMDVTELALTMEQLHESGKVRHFGVSNMHRFQIELIDRYAPSPMVVNQLELSLSQLGFLEQGVTVATQENANVGFDAGTLEYCQLNDIQIQSWAPLSQGVFSGAPLAGSPSNVVKTAGLVSQLAEKYEVAQEAVVLAWLMKLPYGIQPVIGTTDPQRINGCVQAHKALKSMTREDWYHLYVSARGHALP